MVASTAEYGRLARVTAALAAVVLVAGVASAVSRSAGDSDAASKSEPATSSTTELPTTVAPTAPPEMPVEWDARVVDLVGFVEGARGLAFQRPVVVDFLSAEQFSAEARVAPEDLSALEQDEAEGSEGFQRSLVLTTCDVDVGEAANLLRDEGTLAFYLVDDERIVIRGTEVTPEARPVLVHELTHALQDQHFDLGRTFDSDGAQLAFRALAEGDALRVERAYEAEVAGEDQGVAVYAFDTLDDPTLAAVPAALAAIDAAPYVFGATFVELLERRGGVEALNAAFAAPPTTEEHLFDPFTYIAGQQPVTVLPPSGPDGSSDPFDEGDFGAITWYLLLAERIDPLQALAAVDGWAGDAFVAYDDQGRTCTTEFFVGDTPADDDETGAALDSWAETMPSGAATVERLAAGVELTACDPGPDAAGPAAGRALEVLPVPAYRTALVVLGLDSDFTEGESACVASELLARVSYDRLFIVLTEPDPPPDLDDALGAALGACV
ncbi:hypothetical protein BH18ACT4_BH18ACT4_01280 [soil metagenome]